MAPGQTAGWATTERRWSAWRPPRVAATTRTSRSTASTPSATVARSTSSPRYPRLPAEATIARPSVVELQAELTQLRERVGRYPEHLVDRLHTARSACAEGVAGAGPSRTGAGRVGPGSGLAPELEELGAVVLDYGEQVARAR